MKKIAVLVIAMMLVLSAAALADPMGLYQAGDQISDFTLELTDGEEFVLSEQVGKVVVVDLWATWCPNCVEYSIPALAYLHANYPEDVAVVAVNCGDPAEDVKAYVENMGYEFPAAIDEELDILYNYFPTSGIPYTIFIDQEGKFYTASLGGGEGLTEYYVEIVEEMLETE